MSGRELTPKQEQFVAEYLVDLNAAAAARRAGYSESCARAIGYENLTKPHIAERIQQAMKDRASRLEVTQDEVVRELARVAFADLRRLARWDEERVCFVPSEDLSLDQAAAVSEVKAETTHYTREDGTQETKIRLKLKTYDKLKALHDLGRHLGMFTDRLEVTGKDGGPIEVDVANVRQRFANRIGSVAERRAKVGGNGRRNGS